MAILGGAQTNKFVIGNFELRVGPQSMAGRLTSAHSVGVVDKFSLSTKQDTVDLNALFPQEIIDTEIVSQSSELTATVREFSSKNFNILIGNGVDVDNTIKTGAVVKYTPANGYPNPLSFTLGSTASATMNTSVNGGLQKQVMVIDSAGASGYALSSAYPALYDATSKKLTFSSTDSLNSKFSSASKYTHYIIPKVNTGFQATSVPPLTGGLLSSSATSASAGIGLISTDKKSITLLLTSDELTNLNALLKNTTYFNAPASTTPNTYPTKNIQYSLVVEDPTGTYTIVPIVVASMTLLTTGVTLNISSAISTTDLTKVKAYMVNDSYEAKTPESYFGKISPTNVTVASGAIIGKDTITFDTHFSQNDADYVGAQIVFNPSSSTSAGAVSTIKFSPYIAQYDGSTRTATLSNNLSDASGYVAGMTLSLFSLYTVTMAFTGKLYRPVGDTQVIVSAVNGTSKEIKVSGSIANNDKYIGGWLAIPTSDGKHAVSTQVIDMRYVSASNTTTITYDTYPTTSGITPIADLNGKTLMLSSADIGENMVGATKIRVLPDSAYSNSGLTAGSQLLVYDNGDPTESQILTVTSVTVNSDSTRDISVTPTLAFSPYMEANDYIVTLIDTVGFGRQTGSKYFSASLVMLDRETGAPIVFDFWKVTLSSGINLSINTNDFASTDMVLSILEPTLSERNGVYSSIASTMMSSAPVYRITMLAD